MTGDEKRECPRGQTEGSGRDGGGPVSGFSIPPGGWRGQRRSPRLAETQAHPRGFHLTDADVKGAVGSLLRGSYPDAVPEEQVVQLLQWLNGVVRLYAAAKLVMEGEIDVRRGAGADNWLLSLPAAQAGDGTKAYRRGDGC